VLSVLVLPATFALTGLLLLNTSLPTTKGNIMVKLQTIVLRVAGVFGSSALAAVAGGAIFGVELWKSAAIAGVVSASKVTEALLRSWSEDGVLSKEEVAAAFGKANK